MEAPEWHLEYCHFHGLAHDAIYRSVTVINTDSQISVMSIPGFIPLESIKSNVSCASLSMPAFAYASIMEQYETWISTQAGYLQVLLVT